MPGITELTHLGPKSRLMLVQAGIHTEEQLREMGAVRAYLQVKHSGCNATLNLLWALEGWLLGQHWRDVAKQHRLRLLLELDEIAGQFEDTGHAATTPKL